MMDRSKRGSTAIAWLAALALAGLGLHGCDDGGGGAGDEATEGAEGAEGAASGEGDGFRAGEGQPPEGAGEAAAPEPNPNPGPGPAPDVDPDPAEGPEEPDMEEGGSPQPDPDPSAGPPFEMPSGCWLGARPECDPLDPAACSSPGAACDLGFSGGQSRLICYDGPGNDAPLGGACDNHGGPWCQSGLRCGPTKTCVPFCCQGADCAPGESCIAIDVHGSLGTLGVCMEPMACGLPGAHCHTNADCCSGDCHFDHCH